LAYEDFIDKKHKYICKDLESNSNSRSEKFLIISIDVKAYDLINIFHSKYVGLDVFNSKNILMTLRSISNELKNKPVGFNNVIDLMSTKLVYEIIRSFLSNQPLFSGIEENYKYFSDEKILNLFSFIENNLNKELSNKVLSNHLNISEDYVGQFFRNSIGFSPQDYIEHKRMEKAIDLLRDEKNAVKVISNDVGYKDTAYFCRRFKMMFGVQAGKMRKRLGEI
jgi:YesN/AraC family two-component response regulator